MIIDLFLLETEKLKKYEFIETFELKKNPFKSKDLNFVDDFYIEIFAVKCGNTFEVKGKYEGFLKLVCDKCGDEYKHHLKNNFIFYMMKKNVKEEDSDSDEVGDIINFDEFDKFDLSEHIREHILLSLPTVNKCKKNCKGLCPYCGQNLNEKSCDCENEEINPAFENILKDF